MIAFLEGILQEITDGYVILNVHGVGYEVAVPSRVIQVLKSGEPLRLYTHPVYREDSQSLYGFLTLSDRHLFGILIEKVGGVGPKLALALLDRFTAEQLYEWILTSNVAALSECPGVGKKTAQRILMELKEPLVKRGLPLRETDIDSRHPTYAEILKILMALGYARKSSEAAVEHVLGQFNGLSTEETVKKALAHLAKPHTG
jgi:Holliday junction DNA helicase RuvA